MKKKLLLYCGLVSTGYSWSQSIAPFTLNSSGGSAVQTSGISDWSIGEMALVSTFSTTNLVVTQGVLQIEPMVTSVHEDQAPLPIRVFPNPTQDAIYITSDFKMEGNPAYILMDLAGRIIQTGELNFASGNQKGKIDVSALIPGNYLLEINVRQDGKTRVENYKIQKN